MFGVQSMKRIHIKAAILLLFMAATHAWTANITIEPYLQDLSNDSIKIVWWTDTQAEQNRAHIIKPIKMTTNATSTQHEGVTFVRHIATVQGLKPDTEYEYYVESDSTRSRQYHFRSGITRDESFNFFYIGDGQK